MSQPMNVVSSRGSPHPPSAGDRSIEFVCSALIIAIAVYYPYLGKLFSPSIDPNRFRDFGILIAFSEWVFDHGHYPIGLYFYPPTNAITMHLVSQIGPETAFRLHLVMQSLALVLTLIAWSHMIGISHRPDRARIALCACLASLFYVSFELKMHNINMLCLGIVSVSLWLRDRPWLSGALFTFALANKPYGLALIAPWMFWNREFRWCLATGAWILITLLLVPFAWFGAESTLQLYTEWLQSLAMTSSSEWLSTQPLSLRAGLATLLGASPSDGRVIVLTRVSEAMWLMLLAGFFFPALRRHARPSGRVMAAEVSALLIAPLPLGGLQQIARGAVLLVPMLLIAATIFDAKALKSERITLALIMIGTAIAPWIVPVGPLHCALTLVICTLVLLGLAVARNLAGRLSAVSPPVEAGLPAGRGADH